MKILITSITLLAVCLPVFSETDIPLAVAEVTDKDVNFFGGPNFSSIAIGKFDKGDKLEIIGFDKNLYPENENYYFWIQVRNKGKVGYVYSRFLNTDFAFIFKYEDFTVSNSTPIQLLNELTTINEENNLLDAKLNIVETLPPNESIDYVRDSNIYSKFLKEGFQDFKNSFAISKNSKLMKLLPVKYKNNFYYIDFRDVSNVWTKKNNKTYYCRRSFDIFNVLDEKNTILATFANYKDRFMEKNDMEEKLLWTSVSNASLEECVGENLIQLMYVENVFIFVQNSFFQRYKMPKVESQSVYTFIDKFGEFHNNSRMYLNKKN